MSKPSALGTFGFACLLFAVILSGATFALPYYGPGLFAGPWALMAGILLLGACSGMFTLLAILFGVYSFRSPWGKVAAIGGLVLSVGDLVFLLWAFSLS